MNEHYVSTESYLNLNEWCHLHRTFAVVEFPLVSLLFFKIPSISCVLLDTGWLRMKVITCGRSVTTCTTIRQPCLVWSRYVLFLHGSSDGENHFSYIVVVTRFDQLFLTTDKTVALKICLSQWSVKFQKLYVNFATSGQWYQTLLFTTHSLLADCICVIEWCC